MKRTKKIIFILLPLLCLLMIGCDSAVNPTNTNPSADTKKTGYFIDAPVAGLSYKTTSGLTGVTSDFGAYNYNPGDKVTFLIGNAQIGKEVEASPLVTPCTLTGASSIDEKTSTGETTPAAQEALNIVKFLLTLDEDNSDFGIKIPEDLNTKNLTNDSLNTLLKSDNFADEAPAVLQNLTGEEKELPTDEAAKEHYAVVAGQIDNMPLIGTDEFANTSWKKEWTSYTEQYIFNDDGTGKYHYKSNDGKVEYHDIFYYTYDSEKKFIYMKYKAFSMLNAGPYETFPTSDLFKIAAINFFGENRLNSNLNSWNQTWEEYYVKQKESFDSTMKMIYVYPYIITDSEFKLYTSYYGEDTTVEFVNNEIGIGTNKVDKNGIKYLSASTDENKNIVLSFYDENGDITKTYTSIQVSENTITWDNGKTSECTISWNNQNYKVTFTLENTKYVIYSRSSLKPFTKQ